MRWKLRSPLHPRTWDAKGCGLRFPMRLDENSCVRTHAFLIPLILLLPLRFGIMGVLFAGPAADFMAFILSVVLVRRELETQKNAIQMSPGACGEKG